MNPSANESPRVLLRLLRVAALIGTVLAPAAPVAAQTVSGRVTERSTGAPLPGVYVYLTTGDSAFSTGGLTDPQGVFVLRAPLSGRYELHAELIGYAPRVESVTLTAANTARRNVALSVRAIDLQAISVEARNRCRSGTPAAPVTQQLWEDVSTALRVTKWTQETTAVQFRLVRARRRLDPNTLETRAEEQQSRSGYFAGSPYVALSPERLAEHGFVTRANDGSLEYWAPDATVLLSNSFLENHCFRVAEPEAPDSKLVGLAFEPVTGRALPEIEGVLWVDARTSELERLDFRYVNLPFNERTRWDDVGGRVEFERLDSGGWIVRRWRIRMPVVESQRGINSSSRRLVLSELEELSGEVVDVNGSSAQPRMAPVASETDSLRPLTPRNPARESGSVDPTPPPSVTAWAPGRVGITGIVTAEGRPVAGVALVLADRAGSRLASTVSQEKGTFSLPRPAADGVYRLNAEHIGYTPMTQEVELREGESAVVEVRLATRALQLGEIRVTARRRDFLADVGFYARRQRGFGWFMDPEEIDRRMPSRITDLLTRAAGVQVISQGPMDSDIRLIASSRLRGQCPPSIYIDGVAARLSPRTDPALTQLVDVWHVAAIEVFRRPAEIPVQYRGSASACGVVLVWLKR